MNSDVTAVNTELAANTASVRGGALYGLAGQFNFTHVTVRGNHANSSAGGIWTGHGSGSGTLTITNAILTANTDAGGSDEGAQLEGLVPQVSHSLVGGWTGALGGNRQFWINAALC